MARISGVDLPREKRVDIGLTYVFGIGRASALSILSKAGIDGAIRVKDLSEEHIVKIREIIQEGHQVEGDLRKTFSMNVKRLIDSGTYRGLRHRKGLPVRGQRTKTNARTRKGRRSGVGSKPKPPVRLNLSPGRRPSPRRSRRLLHPLPRAPLPARAAIREIPWRASSR
ncbi:MAG: 30S ribosomal protein S13 [Nitrospira sp.]|nr:MAG: 30S ribosomal protein S13 [Nitrospira sp.]